jgi:two-component system response regulator DevR
MHVEDMTPGCIRVLDCLIDGGPTDREIGERLHLSEKTIKTYMSQAFRRTGLHTRTAVALWWFQVQEREEVA